MAVLNSSKSVFASASITIVWQRCPQPISRWPFTIGKRLRRVAIGLIARCDGRCCLGRAGQHRLLLDGANPASVDRDRKLSTKIGYLESRLGPMREQFWHGRCRCFAGARPALASNPFVPQPCGLGSRIVKYSAGAFSFQAWRSSVPPSRLFSSSWTGNREEPAVGPAESMININRYEVDRLFLFMEEFDLLSRRLFL